jgi:nucleoside-diphosphate-sugar epimerase
MPSLDNLSSLQTILGSGGSIGVELAKALPAYTDRIRLVSRNPKKVNPMDELMPADLTKAADIDRAVAGSAIVYVTVGFEYNTKVWQNTWPPFMRQVIDACIRHQARLVFFDNVYMYDPERLSPMTEQTPMRPSSKKGLVRKELVDMIFEAVKDGQLTALIARSADFIGPKNSVLVETVHKNLQNGKKANWFANADKLHNFTFTPDAGKATALLGNTPDAYNQVWHLPTDRTPLTGKDWVELFAKEMNVEPKVQAIPAWLLSVLGVFIPIMREFKEMAYQYDRDYVFDSSKFEKRFDFKPTPPQQAVSAVVNGLSV